MKYPIYFEDYHKCINCGAPMVMPINQYGKDQKVMIYPITHMICKACGKEYFIKWIDKDGKKIPVCCSDDDKKEFIDKFNRGE